MTGGKLLNFKAQANFAKVIDEVADKLGRNRSEFIREALMHYIAYLKETSLLETFSYVPPEDPDIKKERCENDVLQE